MPQEPVGEIEFYGFDGDKVGSTIELYLIRNEIEILSVFSRRVSMALEAIRKEVVKNNGRVIFCAGDSILFEGQFDKLWCERILGDFVTATGCTASLGIGSTPIAAYLALKLAKAVGGGRIRYYELSS